MKIADGQKEIEQDLRPRVAKIREELRMAGRVFRLPSLHEAEATLREITDGPEPETYQGRRNILEGINELRMTYLEGELEISGKVPIRTESAESTASGQKKCNLRLHVVVQEGSPALRWRLAMAHQILADAGFAHIDAELEQFPVNARCSPKRILATQPTDPFADVFPNRRPPRSAATDFPQQTEAPAVPSNDRVGCDEDQSRPPAAPHRAQPYP
jgi:hypothetical protein